MDAVEVGADDDARFERVLVLDHFHNVCKDVVPHCFRVATEQLHVDFVMDVAYFDDVRLDSGRDNHPALIF